MFLSSKITAEGWAGKAEIGHKWIKNGHEGRITSNWKKNSTKNYLFLVLQGIAQQASSLVIRFCCRSQA
jgi:hypothetical protein